MIQHGQLRDRPAVVRRMNSARYQALQQPVESQSAPVRPAESSTNCAHAVQDRRCPTLRQWSMQSSVGHLFPPRLPSQCALRPAVPTAWYLPQAPCQYLPPQPVAWAPTPPVHAVHEQRHPGATTAQSLARRAIRYAVIAGGPLLASRPTMTPLHRGSSEAARTPSRRWSYVPAKHSSRDQFLASPTDL